MTGTGHTAEGERHDGGPLTLPPLPIETQATPPVLMPLAAGTPPALGQPTPAVSAPIEMQAAPPVLMPLASEAPPALGQPTLGSAMSSPDSPSPEVDEGFESTEWFANVIPFVSAWSWLLSLTLHLTLALALALLPNPPSANRSPKDADRALDESARNRQHGGRPQTRALHAVRRGGARDQQRTPGSVRRARHHDRLGELQRADVRRLAGP